MPIGTIEKALHLYSRIQTRMFTYLVSSQFKDFGHGARVAPPFRFYGLNQMVVGKDVMIHKDCWLQTFPGFGDPNSSKLVIKSNAGIGMGAHISAAKQVLIEEYVMLAPNVYISDVTHAFESINLPIMSQGINGIAPVTIGRSTWLGHNVVVLPGVTIGQHCVIGANSVVNSCMPDYCVAVGAPARVVKQYSRETSKWEKVKAIQKPG